MLEIGSEYTRDEIHQFVGGSIQAYLPTVAGRVVAVCIEPELNPQAPIVVLCGSGPKIQQTGMMLAKEKEAIPVFVKQAASRWQYHGKFKVIGSYISGHEFDNLVAESGRDPADVSVAIRLASI